MNPVLLAALLLAPAAVAEEGMWTLEALPLAALKERHSFVPSAEWIARVRGAAVRFNDGGSGSFVSGEGLVLTNHHVAMGQLQKMSAPGRDFVKDGFLARSRAEERPCPDLELNVLVSAEEVTGRVRKAEAGPDAGRLERRNAEIARITKESQERTGLRSDVVELYRGGEYWLYRYRKYTDVRLVMAPELQAAFYGGDPDNFTYPRWAMDFAFFRVYEDGKPLRPSAWLPWDEDGAAAGELVFTAGHPGRTDRLMTVAQLEVERDAILPARLAQAREARADLLAYASGDAERARRIQDRLYGLENWIKAMTGELEGLRTPALLDSKRRDEAALRALVAKSTVPAAAAARGSWERVERAAAALKELQPALVHRVYGGVRSGMRLESLRGVADIASVLVRRSSETAKPNEARYPEFADAALDSQRRRLLSPAPLHPDLEEAAFAGQLRRALAALGPRDPFVAATLAGRTPEAAARAVVGASRLYDPEVRRALLEGGPAAVAASTDPLVVWARTLDPLYRAQRKEYEDRVESPLAAEGARLAAARFAVYGRSTYPDATFTLRLSYGAVAGYELGTTLVAPFTTFHGLYERAATMDAKPPFDLPARVAAAEPRLALRTRLNFVSTNDIIGGNSGSPVIGADGRLVGLIFDGNIQSLAGRYDYDVERNRAVSVHAAGILEALRKIYGADGLAAELTRR